VIYHTERAWQHGADLVERQVEGRAPPWAGGPPSGRGAMFVATVRTEYQLNSSQQRQSCASCASPIPPSTASPCTIRRARWCITSSRSARWTEDPLPHSSSWSAPSTAARVPLAARAGTGAQVVTAHLGADAITATPLTICYTHRVLVQLHGHLLHLDMSRPTKGLTVQFSYGGCGIRYVNVLDYVASSRQPVLSRLPAAGPTPSIALRFDGWVMPKAGAAFVWVLEEEMAGVGPEVSERPTSKTPH
jgi:hypothetical protein